MYTYTVTASDRQLEQTAFEAGDGVRFVYALFKWLTYNQLCIKKLSYNNNIKLQYLNFLLEKRAYQRIGGICQIYWIRKSRAEQ